MIIKKDYFFDAGCFNEKLKHAEDEEFSLKLKEKGYKLFLNPKLSVNHMKYFNFFSLLKNDFEKSTQLTEIFISYFFKKK